MKKIAIIFSLVLIAFTSCNKDETVSPLNDTIKYVIFDNRLDQRVVIFIENAGSDFGMEAHSAKSFPTRHPGNGAYIYRRNYYVMAYPSQYNNLNGKRVAEGTVGAVNYIMP